jgi:hypothetical protein
MQTETILKRCGLLLEDPQVQQQDPRDGVHFVAAGTALQPGRRLPVCLHG